jgi:hypothetical protein
VRPAGVAKLLDRPLHELGLPSVTMRGHHRPPGGRAGQRGAVVSADHVQAEVEAGGDAGGGH